MYAHYAVVLFRLGQAEEAERYYRKFLAASEEYDRDDYLIMPYLFDRKMYDQVIRMNAAREKMYIMAGGYGELLHDYDKEISWMGLS